MKRLKSQEIKRHGEALLAAFPNAKERDPVKLYRKLRRIENKAHRAATCLCNTCTLHLMELPYGKCDIEQAAEEAVEAFFNKIRADVMALLGINKEKAEEVGLFINLDPRGHALKISYDWVRGYNCKAELQLQITTDFGGYGILAPDFE